MEEKEIKLLEKAQVVDKAPIMKSQNYLN